MFDNCALHTRTLPDRSSCRKSTVTTNVWRYASSTYVTSIHIDTFLFSDILTLYKPVEKKTFNCLTASRSIALSVSVPYNQQDVSLEEEYQRNQPVDPIHQRPIIIRIHYEATDIRNEDQAKKPMWTQSHIHVSIQSSRPPPSIHC